MLKVIGLVLWIAAIGGWVNNIVKFTECDFESPYKCEVIRGIGIAPIAPMGVITGYMDLENDGK